MVQGQPRVIELRQFDCTKLIKVDVVEQQFKVQFFCQFAFPGGALDEKLMKMDKDEHGKYKFSFGANGKPDWLPSAGWFADQFDTNNGIDWCFADNTKMVIIDGDDIIVKFRIEGSFYERLELEDFPFDTQTLTMSLAVNVRTTGMTPVKLQVAPDALLSVDMKHGLQVSQFYDIMLRKEVDSRGNPLPKVDVSCYEIGTSEDRMFPAIDISFHIERKALYYVLNVTVPLLVFNLLAFMQFSVDALYIPDRLSISLTLVLTTAAYKFAVAALVPQLSYMTMLDSYLLANWMIIVLISFAGGTVGLFTSEDYDSMGCARAWACTRQRRRAAACMRRWRRNRSRISPLSWLRACACVQAIGTASELRGAPVQGRLQRRRGKYAAHARGAADSWSCAHGRCRRLRERCASRRRPPHRKDDRPHRSLHPDLLYGGDAALA